MSAWNCHELWCMKLKRRKLKFGVEACRNVCATTLSSILESGILHRGERPQFLAKALDARELEKESFNDSFLAWLTLSRETLSPLHEVRAFHDLDVRDRLFRVYDGMYYCQFSCVFPAVERPQLSNFSKSECRSELVLTFSGSASRAPRTTLHSTASVRR